MTSLGESLGIALRESANLGRAWNSLWGKWSESKTSWSLEAIVLLEVRVIGIVRVSSWASRTSGTFRTCRTTTRARDARWILKVKILRAINILLATKTVALVLVLVLVLNVWRIASCHSGQTKTFQERVTLL